MERALNQVDGYLASDLADDPFVTFAGPEGWDGEAAWRDDLAAAAREESSARRSSATATCWPTTCCPWPAPTSAAGSATWLGADGADLYRIARPPAHHARRPQRRRDPPDRPGRDRAPGRRVRRGRRPPVRHDRPGRGLRPPAHRPDPPLRPRRDETMADAQRCLERAEAAMGEWFGRLPQTPCAIKAVPAFLAADAPAAYYFPPAADGSRPGAYFVNTHEPDGATASRPPRSRTTRPSPATTCSSRSPTSSTDLPRVPAASASATRPSSRAGRSTPSGWPTRWASTATTSTASACWPATRGGRAAWSSTPACTRWAGPASRRSTSWWPTPGRRRRDHRRGRPLHRHPRPGAGLQGRPAGDPAAAGARPTPGSGDAFDVRAFHDAVLGSGTVSLPVLRELVAAARD